MNVEENCEENLSAFPPGYDGSQVLTIFALSYKSCRVVLFTFPISMISLTTVQSESNGHIKNDMVSLIQIVPCTRV